MYCINYCIEAYNLYKAIRIRISKIQNFNTLLNSILISWSYLLHSQAKCSARRKILLPSTDCQSWKHKSACCPSIITCIIIYWDCVRNATGFILFPILFYLFKRIIQANYCASYCEYAHNCAVNRGQFI